MLLENLSRGEDTSENGLDHLGKGENTSESDIGHLGYGENSSESACHGTSNRLDYQSRKPLVITLD